MATDTTQIIDKLLIKFYNNRPVSMHKEEFMGLTLAQRVITTPLYLATPHNTEALARHTLQRQLTQTVRAAGMFQGVGEDLRYAADNLSGMHRLLGSKIHYPTDDPTLVYTLGMGQGVHLCGTALMESQYRPFWRVLLAVDLLNDERALVRHYTLVDWSLRVGHWYIAGQPSQPFDADLREVPAVVATNGDTQAPTMEEVAEALMSAEV
ncbi:MAG TPA: hypothetical protein VLA88_02915 [Candidatus Saccharimonadales bacterium]|nr:hypothetical protein [Candidatus Saccharimonadales bacterium]